jgi:hypothetical protein
MIIEETRILQRLQQRLDELLEDCSGMRGYLMQGALTNLNRLWDQLFLYMKDGRYNIDLLALPLSSCEVTERTVTNVFSLYTLK